MYLKELKLWNFRKYGSDSLIDLSKPNLIVHFQKGLNVLIGENDSGKTAILDAIKLVLKTHAYEWIKPDDNDFYNESSILRIEIEFGNINSIEAKNFIEWMGWTKENDAIEGRKLPILILIYQLERQNGKILPTDLKAGMDGVGNPLNAEAREYLKTTYLKALRDADNDLTAKKNSRLSQILQEHKLLKKNKNIDNGVELPFVQDFKKLNEEIEKWFENDTINEGSIHSNKSEIKGKIDGFLQNFITKKTESKFSIGEPNIKNILEKISLGIATQGNLGLGTMNRLYMATELLHLKKEWDGLKLCMIEELEAHLHPQAQMKIIDALKKEENEVQFILTTHSPNLASKVPLKNLILCKGDNVFSLNSNYTKLKNENYKYLERFLDVTKSNLFFAKGVIIVEGWSEEILIPELAMKFGYDLTQREISIVNVASTAYLHFAKIFLQKDNMPMLDIPVSIITDLDNRPDQTGKFIASEKTEKKTETIKELETSFEGTSIQLFIAKEWTLEWCLYKSPTLSKNFVAAVSTVHSGTEEFKDGCWDETKFISKLKKEKGTSPLDKVEIAVELAELLKKENISLTDSDEYILYLVNAIKHACNEN